MGKHFVKGLAAGAILGAVASVLLNSEEADEKKAALVKAAKKVKKKVADHSKSVGKLTKSAYGKIVDTTVAEFRGVKDLSEDELKELRAELKASWKDLEGMMKKKPSAKKAPAKSKGKKKK